MTFDELLKASVNGLPNVTYKNIKYSTTLYGKVVVIRDSSNFKGCAVRFNGSNYDEWFYTQDAADGRKKYMKDLTLIK